MKNINKHQEMIRSIAGKTIAVVYIFEGESAPGAKHYAVWQADVISAWLVAIQELRCICRTINPYEMAFHFIANYLDDSVTRSSNTHFYTQAVNYSYIHTKYFNKFCDLIDIIVGSTDKWLVFMSNKDDGIDLTVRLTERPAKESQGVNLETAKFFESRKRV